MSDLPEFFDLHVHSIRSDGLLSPLQLMELARRSGLAGLAITDHDTLPDERMFRLPNSEYPVELLVGVEISTELFDRGFHVLGYGFDPTQPDLVALCQQLQARRQKRCDWMIQALERSGIRLDPDRAVRILEHSAPCRSHLARELFRSGRVSNIRAAFRQYLTPLELNAPPARVQLTEAVRTIHQAGGQAVLAHPPTGLTYEQWHSLVDSDLDGIETRFPSASNSHRRFLDQRAQEYGLRTTAGSDYHGGDSPNYLGMHTVDRAELDRLLQPKVSYR